MASNTIKIAKGNDFQLHFPLVIYNQDGVKESIDASALTDVSVQVGRGSNLIDYAYTTNDNYIIVDFDETLARNTYDVHIVAKYNDRDIASHIKECFQIVDWNSETNWQNYIAGSRIQTDTSVFIGAGESTNSNTGSSNMTYQFVVDSVLRLVDNNKDKGHIRESDYMLTLSGKSKNEQFKTISIRQLRQTLTGEYIFDFSYYQRFFVRGGNTFVDFTHNFRTVDGAAFKMEYDKESNGYIIPDVIYCFDNQDFDAELIRIAAVEKGRTTNFRKMIRLDSKINGIHYQVVGNKVLIDDSSISDELREKIDWKNVFCHIRFNIDRSFCCAYGFVTTPYNNGTGGVCTILIYRLPKDCVIKLRRHNRYLRLQNGNIVAKWNEPIGMPTLSDIETKTLRIVQREIIDTVDSLSSYHELANNISSKIQSIKGDLKVPITLLYRCRYGRGGWKRYNNTKKVNKKPCYKLHPQTPSVKNYVIAFAEIKNGNTCKRHSFIQTPKVPIFGVKVITGGTKTRVIIKQLCNDEVVIRT